MIRIEVSGPPLDIAKDAEKQFRKDARKAIGQAGTVLLREVKKQLRRTSSRETAGPGEPPARRTGELIRSFRRLRPRVRTRAGATVATSGVKSTHPGAGRVEYGGVDRRGIRTFPHPYIGPAIDAAEAEVERLLTQVIE